MDIAMMKQIFYSVTLMVEIAVVIVSMKINVQNVTVLVELVIMA
jgi:hypothetical protein